LSIKNIEGIRIIESRHLNIFVPPKSWEKNMTIQIKNLLQQSVNRAGITKEVRAAVVCNEFDKIITGIFGNKAKNKVKAQYVKNNTLTVAVLSSVWGQEIKLHEQEILEKLHNKVGQNKVERLRFLV